MGTAGRRGWGGCVWPGGWSVNPKGGVPSPGPSDPIQPGTLQGPSLMGARGLQCLPELMPQAGGRLRAEELWSLVQKLHAGQSRVRGVAGGASGSRDRQTPTGTRTPAGFKYCSS